MPRTAAARPSATRAPGGKKPDLTEDSLEATSGNDVGATATTRPSLADEKDYVRALYYGDPGKAKTTNAAAMARLGRVVYIDSENGLKPSALKRQGVPIENIEPYRDISYEALRSLAWDVKGRLDDGEPIVGVVWDSMTATLPYFIDDLVGAAVAKATRSGQVRESWKTYQDDYGDMTNQVREVLRLLRDLPCHLALTAHARKGKDEEGMVEVGPNVTPALQGDLFAFMDQVLHVRTLQAGEQTLYTAVSTPTGRFKAKDRFGVLPPNLVTPTFDRLVGYVDGTLDPASDEVQTQARQALAQAASTTTNNTESQED